MKVTPQLTIDRARLFGRLLDDAQNSSTIGTLPAPPKGLMKSVVVEIIEAIEADDFTQHDATLLTLVGTEWESTEQRVKIRNLSFAPLAAETRTIADPVSRWGFCVRTPGLGIRHGIVTEILGCGYYTIELGIWTGNRAEAGIDIGSGSGAGDCSPCFDVTGEGTSDCGITLTTPPCQVTGIGEYVTAYDDASGTIPLVVGTSCKLIDMGDKDAEPSGSGSGSSSGEKIWQILRGRMNHIVEYVEERSCCGPNGPETLLIRIPKILIGFSCDPISCGECPDLGSGSGA